jgi:hypothetical protein
MIAAGMIRLTITFAVAVFAAARRSRGGSPKLAIKGHSAQFLVNTDAFLVVD